MQQRNLLRKQLSEAWRKTIEVQYQGQRINSEHGLQVYFCAALLGIFQKANIRRRIFIEPAISKNQLYPDIIICNTKQIIGVVELKYQPRGRQNYKKDIDTLEFVVTHPNELFISNDRFLGKVVDSRSYPLAKNAVLCWGGVYTGKVVDLSSKVSINLIPRFLQLHAVTAHNEHPVISIFGEK
jgi:hypothetical protein